MVYRFCMYTRPFNMYSIIDWLELEYYFFLQSTIRTVRILSKILISETCLINLKEIEMSIESIEEMINNV